MRVEKQLLDLLRSSLLMTSRDPFRWKSGGTVTFQGIREWVNNEEMKAVAEYCL